MFRKIYGIKQRIIQSRDSGDELGKVLMFHQVNDDLAYWKSANTAITEKNFKRLIEGLISENYRFISPSEIEEKTDAKSILITFDDVFHDGVENGISYLISRGIPFTIFVSEKYLGKDDFITFDQLEILKQEPLCTIGSHCISHSILRKLNHDLCKKEIFESKKNLEQLMGREIKYLAYPYGSVYAVGNREQKYAEDAGYRLAFSTMQVGLNKRSVKNKYFLPRYNICDDNFGRHINVK